MLTYNELLKLKTDEERLLHLHEVSYTDWPIVAQWEKETTNPKHKRIFHSEAVSLYHIEEFRTYGEI